MAVFNCLFAIICIFCMLMLGLNLAFAENVPRFWFNQRANEYQGTLNEFITMKTTTERVIAPHQPYVPCIPHQFYPTRSRRSLYFRRKKFVTIFPINIYEQNVNNIPKPDYNHYGGYYCGNERPNQQSQQSVNNNLFPISNIFNGIFGINRNAVPLSSSDNGDIEIRPVRESNNNDHNTEEV